jgi:outer membrane protein OmpA-like peptidoglycan-associated protein
MRDRATDISTRGDLLSLVKRQMTPEAIGAAANELGEDRERMASAVSAMVPTVLEALSDVARTDRGAAHLTEAIASEAAVEEPSPVVRLVGGGTRLDRNLLDDELGGGAWALSNNAARSAGIGRESAHRLLGGVASMTLFALAKSGRAISPGALRSVLGSAPEGDVVYDATTEYGATAEPERHMGSTAIRELERPRRSWTWLWVVALALAALAAIFLLRSNTRFRTSPPAKPTPAETAPVTAAPPAPPTMAAPAKPAPAQQAAPAPAPQAAAPQPAPPQAAAPLAAAPARDEVAGAAATPVGELAAFLGSDEGGTPRTFPLPISYTTGATTPDAGSTAIVDQLATVLNDNPSAEIRLESHADSLGSTAANQTLSEKRSEAVKSMLVQRGVDEARIETTGMGHEQPTASNDTFAGRTDSRRTDVVVTDR